MISELSTIRKMQMQSQIHQPALSHILKRLEPGYGYKDIWWECSVLLWHEGNSTSFNQKNSDIE